VGKRIERAFGNAPNQKEKPFGGKRSAPGELMRYQKRSRYYLGVSGKGGKRWDITRLCSLSFKAKTLRTLETKGRWKVLEKSAETTDN